MSFGAFYAYEHLTISAGGKALLENVEALTIGEVGGGTDCGYYCNRNIEWNCQLSSLIHGGVLVYLCREYKPKD